jgi:hypothetical protein
MSNSRFGFRTQNGLIRNFIEGSPFSVYDPDAQAFFTASGLTGSTNLTAINQLVLDLKSYGIWTKMKAIYPFVGGTAALHKWNLKDPQDANAAFRLVFNGGWTHSSTGAKPNGTNAYADTFFNPSINSIQNSHHFSVYLRNNEADKIPFGATTINNGLNGGTIIPKLSNQTYYGINQNGYSPTFADSDSRSHYIVTRTASNVSKAFKRNVLQSTSTIGSVLANASYYIGHWNSIGVVQYFSANENAFTTIGDGLSDTEAANLYLCAQNFNTTLARQI